MKEGYDILILDLDGTVYVDGTPIGNVIERLNEFVGEPQKKLLFLSNNTSVSRLRYVEKLTNLGLRTSLEQIITPTLVAGSCLEKEYDRGYIIGTAEFVTEITTDFDITHETENPEFVLIAFDKELTYDKLAKACEWVNAGVPFYLTHIDLACPTSKGPIPDCGSIGQIVQTVTDVDPQKSFGKPSLEMINYLSDSIVNVSKDRVLMAGDRMYTDIALGNKLNIHTLLVLSGETKIEGYSVNDTYNITHCAETLADFFDNKLINGGVVTPPNREKKV